MTENRKTPGKTLDDAIASISKERLDPATAADSADRVWRRITQEVGTAMKSGRVEEIRNCGDYQALITDYLNHNLSEARKILFEDHVRECPDCRKVLTAVRTDQAPRKRERMHREPMRGWYKWAGIAAAIVVAVLLYQAGLIPFLNGPAAVLNQVNGMVFTVADNRLVPLQAEQQLDNRQPIRTGKDSWAVLVLDDGSRIELAERTELALTESWGNTTIRLYRGNVIVEAAEQGAGHLYLSTGECRVSVKGTVFSVSHGMKGSRVAVVEGEVWVEKSGQNTVLTAGEQFASQPYLGAVRIEEEIGWSQNAEEYVALLKEITALQRELQKASFSEELRYSSNLAGLLPAGTVVYGAFPNLSSRLDEVYRLFIQRLEENPELQAWLEKQSVSDEESLTLDAIIEKIKAFGDQLGEEIVVAVIAPDGDVNNALPVVVSTAHDSDQLRQLVEAEVALISGLDEDCCPVVLVSDPFSVADNGQESLYILVDSGLLAVSTSIDLLREIAGNWENSSSGGFVESDLYRTVSESYTGGVDWLFAMDLAGIVKTAAEPESEEAEGLRFLGITRLDKLVVERKKIQENPQNRAALSYEGTPTGVVSWIAQPGPMGALDYVSPDANLVAAFVVEDPVKMMDDVLAFLERTDPEALDEMNSIQLKHGINFRADFAAPLGGEVVFALDGPILPTPAWKIVVEVYDPATLQSTIEWALDEMSRLLAEEGKPGPSLRVDELSGEAVYRITLPEADASLYYKYANGYLIAAPDISLIGQAEQYRNTGYTLASSPDFVAMMPADAGVNISALYYHNLGSLLEPLVDSGLAGALADLTPESQADVQQLVSDNKPLLATMSSEPGRIVFSSGGDLEALWQNMGLLSTLGGPEGIARMIRQVQ